MSSEEIRLAQTWYDQETLAPSQIAQRLGRDKSVITHLSKFLVRGRAVDSSYLSLKSICFYVTCAR